MPSLTDYEKLQLDRIASWELAPFAMRAVFRDAWSRVENRHRCDVETAWLWFAAGGSAAKTGRY